MSRVKTYMDIQITGKTYFISESLKKPRSSYQYSVSNLRKIEEILKNNLTYVSREQYDPCAELSKKRLLTVLEKNAQELNKNYITKSAKLCWLSRKLRRIAHKQNKVNQVYHRICNRIETKRVVPGTFNLPPDAIGEILKRAELAEIKSFAELNQEGKRSANRAFVSKAQNWGFNGNDIIQAKEYLKKVLGEMSRFRKENWTFPWVIPFPENLLNPFLDKLKSLSNFEIIQLFSDEKIYTDSYLILREFFNVKNFKCLKIPANKDASLTATMALQKAVIHQDKNRVELLFQCGVDPSIENGFYFIKAIDKSLIEIAMLFLKYGVLSQAIDANGVSAISFAAQRIKQKSGLLIEAILKNGADPNYLDSTGIYPLYTAVAAKNFKNAQLLCTSKTINAKMGKHGAAALHVACCLGSPRMVEFLLQQNADPNSITNLTGFSPLHYAILENRRSIEIIRLLLNYGADPTVRHQEGSLPIHFAAQSGNRDAACYFLDLNDVNIRGSCGATPLCFACGLDADPHFSIVQLLLQKGADPNIAMDAEEGGLYPLHIAVESRSIEVVELLLAHGANLQVKTASGESPLDFANKNNDSAMLTLFSKYETNN